MQEKKNKLCPKADFTFPLLFISMAGVLLFIFLGFSLLMNYINIVQSILNFPVKWKFSFIVFLWILIGAIIFLFGAIFIILKRSLSAVPRIEEALDKVNQGDYSVRVTTHDKDAMRTLIDKLNKILDLLEGKAKKG